MIFRRTKIIMGVIASVLLFVPVFGNNFALAGWFDDLTCGAASTCGAQKAAEDALKNAVEQFCQSCQQQNKRCVMGLKAESYIGYSFPQLDMRCELSLGAQQEIELSELEAELSSRKPLPRVSIPGLSFSNIMSSTEPSGVYFYIPWIPELIAALYKFGIAAVSIIAVVVIILQGVRVITSAGGEAKQSAYKKIFQSIVGLVIAWGSYAILYNVNPNLVSFNALRVRVVERIEFESEHNCDDPAACNYITNVRPETIPTGAFTSDLALAKANRTAPINYQFFGRVDFTIKRTRDLQNIKRLVIHNGGYTAQGNIDTWLGLYREKGKKTGTHYTIDREGVIYQMIGEEAIASHANAFNSDSIGVELNISKSNGKSCNDLGTATKEAVLEACSPTEVQYQALNSLIADIASRTQLRIDNDGLVGHCEAPGATHGDPRAFDWSKIGLNNQEKKDSISGQNTPCAWYLPF